MTPMTPMSEFEVMLWIRSLQLAAGLDHRGFMRALERMLAHHVPRARA